MWCWVVVMFAADLEKFVIEHAGDYYKRQSRSWMDQDSCPNYLEKAERMLNQEKTRVEAYLHRNTLEPLTRECHIQLLKNHQTELLGKATGVVHLLTVNSTDGTCVTRWTWLAARLCGVSDSWRGVWRVAVCQTCLACTVCTRSTLRSWTRSVFWCTTTFRRWAQNSSTKRAAMRTPKKTRKKTTKKRTAKTTRKVGLAPRPVLPCLVSSHAICMLLACR
jgi:hypothetical protein